MSRWLLLVVVVWSGVLEGDLNLKALLGSKEEEEKGVRLTLLAFVVVVVDDDGGGGGEDWCTAPPLGFLPLLVLKGTKCGLTQ